ncbi:MAG: hypothetical protein NTX03_03440 [Bacteroidetes bacterium]|nr:hypothetical protein [Bacteroidota bacterium]
MTKKHHHILLIALALVLNLLEAKAQDSLKNKPITFFQNGLGFGAGLTIGIGVSYRHMFNRIGGQINTGCTYNMSGNPERKFGPDTTGAFNLGLSFIYILIDSKPANFFLYQGNCYTYIEEKGGQQLKNMNTLERRPIYIFETFTTGIGMGTEFRLIKRIGINLMAGSALYFKQGKADKFNLTVETALHYWF